MRITDRMIMSTVMDNIINNQRKLEELQAQISSGRRIRRPADDPVAVGQSLKLSTDLRQMDQYRRNIATAQSWLRSGEVALQELTTVLQRVRELALTGANGTLSSAQRDNLASEVQQLFNTALGIGNSKHGSRYLFAGFSVLTQPFLATDTPQGYVYQGDGGEIQHEIGVNTTLTINTPGSQVFPQVLAAAKSLLDGLSASDADAIRLSLEQIDTAQDEVLAKLADGGARPNRLAAADGRLQDLSIDVQREFSAAVDLDFAQALSEFSEQENVYLAALKAGAQVITPPLLDYLR